MAELRFDQPLDLPELVLSPSDFGFHNAGRRCDGALQFFYFEYFGWDDPAKLMADFLLHPGMKLTPELKQRFHAGARIALCGDAAFDARFPALYPLFGLCWCLILLNPFRPTYGARRSRSGANTIRAREQATQLRRARSLLEKVKRYDGDRSSYI